MSCSLQTGRVYKTNDGGNSWLPVSIAGVKVRSLLAVNNNLCAGADSNGVYITKDGGTHGLALTTAYRAQQ